MRSTLNTNASPLPQPRETPSARPLNVTPSVPATPEESYVVTLSDTGRNMPDVLAEDTLNPSKSLPPSAPWVGLRGIDAYQQIGALAPFDESAPAGKKRLMPRPR